MRLKLRQLAEKSDEWSEDDVITAAIRHRRICLTPLRNYTRSNSQSIYLGSGIGQATFFMSNVQSTGNEWHAIAI